MKKNIILLIMLITIFIILIFSISIKRKSSNKLSDDDIFINDIKDLSYYKDKYKNRYIDYKNKNLDLDNNSIVIRVNLGLDKPFYTDTHISTCLNKDYILVNKYIYLPEDYVPNDLVDVSTKYSRYGMKLVKGAYLSFQKMYEAAKKDGYTIRIMSSYRSYQYQVNLYNNYKEKDGESIADTYSARPGYSEHQTGLCIDIDDGIINYDSFEKSRSYIWMKNNSYKYGFIERYPKDKEDITGYKYESWHYRYVGEKIAKYIHENNITFDEYYIMFIEK